MAYATAVVLIVPMADPTALPEFVEACVRDQVSLVAVWGPGCQAVEDEIDELRIGDGSEAEARFFCTTAHADESFDEAIEFAGLWVSEDGRSGFEVVRV